MNKKAQVTVFIILGVILLLIAGLVIYVTTQKIVKPVEEKIIVPEGTEPVYEYVSECIYQTAKQGIIRMGMQGGYLDLPPAIVNTPASHISLDPYGTFKTPYWFYNNQDRTPTIDFLQTEINSQLRQKLRDCINFESFKPQYTITQKADFNPKTTIAKDKVIIELNWPLEIRTGDKTIQLNKVITNIDVRLKEVFDIAKTTMEFENNKAVFENITIGLISINPDIPTNGMEIDCTPKKWYLHEIEKQAKEMIHYNMPSIRIENTPYLEFSASRAKYSSLERTYEGMMRDLDKDKEVTLPKNIPDDAYEYFKMLLDIGISKTDITTSFRYDQEWPMTIVAYPHEGNVLRSNRIRGARKYLGYLCLNQWHFVYDIEYPVMMRLKDNTAFKGEGYIFQYAFPVLVNDNTAERQVTDRKPFMTRKYYYEFCEETGEKVYDIRATGITPGAMIARELEGANITYECFDRYCDLGKTSGEGGIYRLRTTIPSGCGNPFITAAKPGYLPATRQLTKDVLEIPLKRLKTMNYEIVIHTYDSDKKLYKETRTDLKKTEHLSIYIGINGTDYHQHKTYSKDDTIDLIDGNGQYEISLLLSRGETLIGGYSQEKVKINYNDIKDKNTIVFHLFEYIPIPLKDEDKSKTAYHLYQGEYSAVLKPTFQ